MPQGVFRRVTHLCGVELPFRPQPDTGRQSQPARRRHFLGVIGIVMRNCVVFVVCALLVFRADVPRSAVRPSVVRPSRGGVCRCGIPPLSTMLLLLRQWYLMLTGHPSVVHVHQILTKCRYTLRLLRAAV